MRQVAAQHRFHETRARLDHGVSNTGIPNKIIRSKGRLLTSGVQTERKRCRLAHLLRHSDIYSVLCPRPSGFFLPSCTSIETSLARTNGVPRRPDFRWIRLKIYTGRGSTEMLELARRFFLLLAVRHALLSCRVFTTVRYHRHYTAKSPYLSRIPVTSCSTLCVSSLH